MKRLDLIHRANSQIVQSDMTPQQKRSMQNMLRELARPQSNVGYHDAVISPAQYLEMLLTAGFAGVGFTVGFAGVGWLWMSEPTVFIEASAAFQFIVTAGIPLSGIALGVSVAKITAASRLEMLHYSYLNPDVEELEPVEIEPETVTNDNGFTRLNSREMTRNGRFYEFSDTEKAALSTLKNGTRITRPVLEQLDFDGFTNYVHVNGTTMTKQRAIVNELVQRRWARRHENGVVTWNGEGKVNEYLHNDK